MVRKEVIPKNPREPRRECSGDVYPCIVCGEPAPNPQYLIHVIDGGSSALVADDEDAYTPDGGDMGFYPIGTSCLRKHSNLKSCAVKVVR